MNQQPTESIEQFITRLRQQAVLCDFQAGADEQIRDQIIEKCKSHKLRTRLLEKGHELTLDQLRTIASTMEMSEVHAKHIEQSSVSSETSSSVHHVGANARNSSKATDNVESDNRCFRCGQKGHFARDSCCPAKGKRCKKCGIVGHFAKSCKTKKGGRSTDSRNGSKFQYGKGKKSGKVHSVESEDENSQERDDYAFKVTGSTVSDSVQLFVDKQSVNFIVDSGATVNIISRKLWEQLKENNISCVSQKTEKRLFSYGSREPLKLVGKFRTVIEVAATGKKMETDVYVMDGEGPPLLGKSAAMELDLLRLGIHMISDVINQYEDCFDGIGRLTNYQIKLHIDDSVSPVAQRMYRLPYSLREKVGQKIDELEAMDIIEKVEGPTPWVSPVIAVPKPDNDIRLVVDMRQANRAIIRERHPIPTVDEILYNINGSKVFSKLDLRSGFHQIELEENSRTITTFVTHKGLYRYKRLMFGISSAPEKYQQVISQVFHDCEGVQNISDDIVVHGRTEKEHNCRLQKVLDRIRERGLTLNRNKCQFGLSEIAFMGHLISENGIGPMSEQVKAVVNARAPKNASETRSFLGLVNFSGRYIQNLATISEPLRRLTRKGVPFQWGGEQEASFQKLKQSLSEAETLGHFSIDADKTIVVTDASNVGLGAVIIQENGGQTKVISYASRVLSKVEKKYSTTEKEALAVVWACEKFHNFLYGVQFLLVTDHKPLQFLYSYKSKPNARIERWVIRLLPYRYTVRYAPGKTNIADSLSRLVDTSTSQESQGLEVETENYVRSVAKEATPIALSTRQVEEESKLDDELAEVRKCLAAGRWDKTCATFYPVRDELSQIGYLILRGTRLVIPKALRRECMELAHQGHLGIVGTKQQLRTKVWWPHMDREVESFVKSCHSCQIVEGKTYPEPIEPTPLPTGPWQDIAVDLMGPLPTGHYVFVVVDYFSRFYELEILRDTSSGKLIDSLETMFCRHGLPQSVTSDNGPQFRSEQFKEYMDNNGIVHRHCTPLHPAANGEVERQNRSLLKRIKIAHAESKNWISEIRTYLLAYRTTPHSVTGMSPAELMFGRKLRTKLPQVEQLARFSDESVRDRDAEKKFRNKIYIDEKRNSQVSDLEVGDTVLMRQKHRDKFSTQFHPSPFKLVGKHGNSCTIESEEGVRYKRNSSFLKSYRFPELDTPKKVNTEFVQKNEGVPPADSKSPETTTVELDNTIDSDKFTDHGSASLTASSDMKDTDHNFNTGKTPGKSDRPVRVRNLPKRFDDYIIDK